MVDDNTVPTVSHHSNDDEQQQEQQQQQQQHQQQEHHLFTPVVLSILATETAERFAYFGFRAVLVLFFVDALQLDETTAISCFAYTTCLANFSPLFGAIMADGALGRFHTILCFGCLYAMGLVILTYAAFLSIDSENDDGLFWKRALTCGGLILVCTGTGGIKRCVNVFGADQVHLRDRRQNNNNNTTTITKLDTNSDDDDVTVDTGISSQETTSTQEDDKDHAVREFFNFFYFCINVGAVSSFAVIPIVKHHYGFGVAFLLPTLFMGFALSLFYSKRREYVYRKTKDGTSLTTTFRYCWELMFRTRRRGESSHHQLLPQQDDKDTDTTKELSFQDEPDASPYSLSSVVVNKEASQHGEQQQHEQQALQDAREALQILPIMAMFPIFWMLYDQQGSVWTLQASRMALHGLEPEQLNILNPLEIMIFIPLFDRIIYPKMERRGWNIAPLRRMGWGMVLAAVSFVVSGFLEHVIEYSSSNDNEHSSSVHVLWQVPQITILAVGEIFISVTGLEYAYSKAPDRLKGFIMATYLLTVAFGDLLGGVLYSSVFRDMDRAVVMYVCAVFMILNRFIFGWVVVATRQQDTTRSTTTGDEVELQSAAAAIHSTDLEPYSDVPQNSLTNGDVLSKECAKSIEMVGKLASNAGDEVRGTPTEESLWADGGERTGDDWLDVDVPKIQIV